MRSLASDGTGRAYAQLEARADWLIIRKETNRDKTNQQADFRIARRNQRRCVRDSIRARRRRRSTSRRAGGAGPNLLAMLLNEKFGQHQPLNRQAERYVREGVPLSLSTLADQVGAACAVLKPLLDRIEAHVLAAERLHGDDTTVPVLAKGKTHTGRCRVYVRDDRPFGGGAPPAAMFYSSRDRGGALVETHLARWSGLLQADAYDGYNRLYAVDRKPGLILEADCWAHARRPFFALADIEASARRKAEGKVPVPISPLALEMVRRIDALFEIERGITAKCAGERRAVRQALSRSLVDELEARMRAERPKLSRSSDLTKAMDYMLKRWPAFTRFLDDGRICLSNNAAERGLRGIALGGKSWLFAGSDRGGERAAATYSLIVTAKMNDIAPQAWLADVLVRIAEHPASRLDELLPWNWRPLRCQRSRSLTRPPLRCSPEAYRLTLPPPEREVDKGPSTRHVLAGSQKQGSDLRG
jgi:transposase